ncbi:helix-turn-helix transcriptional regulator [Spartinivicinus ruber]|uniref:helix-turn-helix transcriptional regulator n=1 Tax=Spartinivicinus ruber TaxID=2683272 RepID=UPI0013D19229|nr:LuxR C-terminal-related transcriptional regulator [Spartinivicinus ruber]
MDSSIPATNCITDGHWQANLNNPYLAPREIKYCIGLLSGKTDKVIAREQGVEPSSVSNRIKNVHYKLNTHNRAHLVAELIRLKIVSPLLIVLSFFALPELPRVVKDDPNKPRPVRIAQRSVRRQETFSTLSV